MQQWINFDFNIYEHETYERAPNSLSVRMLAGWLMHLCSDFVGILVWILHRPLTMTIQCLVQRYIFDMRALKKQWLWYWWCVVGLFVILLWIPNFLSFMQAGWSNNNGRHRCINGHDMAQIKRKTGEVKASRVCIYVCMYVYQWAKDLGVLLNVNVGYMLVKWGRRWILYLHWCRWKMRGCSDAGMLGCRMHDVVKYGQVIRSASGCKTRDKKKTRREKETFFVHTIHYDIQTH